MVGEGEVEEAGSLDLAPVGSCNVLYTVLCCTVPVGSGGSVRHQVHSELSLGRLDGSIGGTSGDLGQVIKLSSLQITVGHIAIATISAANDPSVLRAEKTHTTY